MAEILLPLSRGIPQDPLPELLPRDDSVPHAPKRNHGLSVEEHKIAIRNALRYFPAALHSVLAPEFLHELIEYGHIYMYRFRPTEYVMKAYPISAYPASNTTAAAIMLMIMNNLDPAVAQYPHELVTYGGNGSVFSNWAQYHLTMFYLSKLSDHQTLTVFSGHPMGLFPSPSHAPRVVVTNGLTVPNYSTKADYERMYALGVSQYGQMTAGSYCYIGPQGIVHGTTLTILNAGRKYLGVEDLSGRVYVSSGLGGMSGAQAKAAVICGAIAVVAEVDRVALEKRMSQGWVQEAVYTLDDCINRIRLARQEKKPLSLAFAGNIVLLWERLAEEDDFLVDLGSDQTSCHNINGGGYIPAQLSVSEARKMMVSDSTLFRDLVDISLRRQICAINTLASRKPGLHFWDYGNSFLLEASRAEADVFLDQRDQTPAVKQSKANNEFRYPSYIQDLFSDVFGLGFGPFRWVCSSCDAADLSLTDSLAASCIRDILHDEKCEAPAEVASQYRDNLRWVEQAEEHHLVVGSQARILYSDAIGRVTLALAFNKAIRNNELSGPVIISRDHHDVSGTDSPFRETSNVYDGSAYCADMAVHNMVGDSFRGASWVALHNGGGTGWGEAINGGFGLLLDGTDAAAERARSMLFWDVNNGVVRRSWSGNQSSYRATTRAMQNEPLLQVTVPSWADEDLLNSLDLS